jgi:hypothetical protein
MSETMSDLHVHSSHVSYFACYTGAEKSKNPKSSKGELLTIIDVSLSVIPV